jgi:hypothetical protein
VNRLTLAVAGGRKASSIADACCQAGTEDRILVLTFTQANQRELSDRLAARGPHQGASMCRAGVRSARWRQWDADA